MIAIASGLLGNLETATSTVVKKEAGSGGFAAAFEEVSAKDAGTAAQAGVGVQGRRGAGGGGNRGVQAGILSARSSRTAGLTVKAAIAKSAGAVAAEGDAVEVNGTVDVGVVAKAASSAGADAGKPVFAAKLDAASLIKAEAAGQEAPAGSEARVGGPLVGDEGVPSSAAKGSQSAGSTVAGTLPGGRAKGPLQGSASAVPAVQVGGVATSASKIAGQVDAGTAQTRSAALASAAEGASAKVGIDAVPHGVATEGSTAGDDGSQGVENRFEDGAGVSGTAATKETELAVPVAAGVLGQTARTSKDAGTVVGTKTQGVSGGPQSSTAKDGLQQGSGTVQVQPTDLPVTPAVSVAAQNVSGVVGQPSASVTPVVGAKQTFAEQVTVPSDGSDQAPGQGNVAAGGNAPAVARSTATPQEVLPQQATAPSFVAGPVTVQPVVEQAVRVQTAVAQPAVAGPQGTVGSVDQDAGNVARVLGGPVSEGAQPGAQQVPTTQAGSQPMQTQSVRAEQIGNSEQGAVEQKPEPGVHGAAEAVQYAGKPVVAAVDASVHGDKDKRAPGVTADASGPQKKVGATAGAALSAADASVLAAPIPAPSLAASPLAAATVQSTPVVSFGERANRASGGSDSAKANISSVPVRGASASPMLAGTVADPGGAPGAAPGFDAALESTAIASQAPLTEGVAITGLVGQAQESSVPVAAAVSTEVAAVQANRLAAGGAAARERRLPTSEGRTAERTSAETTPIAQPIASQHLAGSAADVMKTSSGSHPSSSEAGIQSMATGSAGLVPPAATQLAPHEAVAPHITATATANGTVQSSTLTSGTGGLASTGAAGMDSLLSPMAHTTLQATPTVLEVGVPGGTHGWLKIRAEIGEGGTVQASMSAATHEGQETLRRELPAMSAFLDSEHLPVSVQVAAHGVSGTAAISVAGAETGFNLGSGLSQDAGSTTRDAQAGLLAGGDGARQGGGEGSQESSRAVTSARAAVSAESDWVSSSNADAGSGYGSGISANGGSWLNVMA